MDLHRLTPTSLSNAKSHYAGHCAGCEAPVRYREQVVHLYGETFHYDCAFYRPIRHGIRQGGCARPA